MSDIQPVTWLDDPAHFRRTSRREFLFVEPAAALGLAVLPRVEGARSVCIVLCGANLDPATLA